MITIVKKLIDWIYYNKCYFCSKHCPHGIICENCIQDIKENLSTKRRLISNIEIYSIATYKDKIQKLIRGLKYHNKKEFSVPTAQILYEFWQKTGKSEIDFEIIPMPLHIKRQKHRKYNHTELIANEFSKLSGYKVNTNLVSRIKDTKPQYKLKRQERLINLKNAFNVDLAHYSGKNLLLLDDICTTGVTMQEMIKALNKAGINKLCGLVISTLE